MTGPPLVSWLAAQVSRDILAFFSGRGCTYRAMSTSGDGSCGEDEKIPQIPSTHRSRGSGIIRGFSNWVSLASRTEDGDAVKEERWSDNAGVRDASVRDASLEPRDSQGAAGMPDMFPPLSRKSVPLADASSQTTLWPPSPHDAGQLSMDTLAARQRGFLQPETDETVWERREGSHPHRSALATLAPGPPSTGNFGENPSYVTAFQPIQDSAREEAQRILGLRAKQAEREQRMRTILGDVVRKIPRNPQAYFHQGLLYFRQRKFALASEAFQNALNLTQNASFRARLINHIAQCAVLSQSEGLETPQLEQVQDQFRGGINLDSTQADIWNNVGLMYILSANDEAAVRVYEKILEFYPEYADAQNNFGVSYLSHDLSKAIAAFQTVSLSEHMHSGALNNYCAVLLLQKEFDVALDFFKNALERDAGRASIWNNLAIFHYHMGAASLALEAFKQALAFEPNNLAIRCNLARLFAQLGEFGSAEELLRNVKLQDTNLWEAKAFVATARYTLAKGPREQKEYGEKAIAAFNRALLNKHILNHLGLLCLTEGNYAFATKFLKLDVKNNGGTAASLCNLAIAVQLNGDLDDALHVYEKVVELQQEEIQKTLEWSRVHTGVVGRSSPPRLHEGDEDMSPSETTGRESMDVPEHKLREDRSIWCAVMNNFGNLLRQKDPPNNFARAESCFVECLRVEPQNALAYNNLALLCIARLEVEDARKNLLLALDCDPALDIARSNLIKLNHLVLEQK